MKRAFITFVLYVVVLYSGLFAFSPLPPKPLSDRIDLASHVFVGTVKGVELVRVHEGTHPGTVVFIVRVQEILYPKDTSLPEAVVVTALHGIEFPFRENIGESYVFIVNERPNTEPLNFISPISREVRVRLDQKDEVIDFLKKKKPNKALQTTPPAVTPRADARGAPSGYVSDL